MPSFLIGGLICYFHWEAMLISHVAERVVRMPFNNMQELYESDYKLSSPPGSTNWDDFKYGNTLWKRIFKDQLEPFEDEYKPLLDAEKQIEWLFTNEKNAVYWNYFRIRRVFS